jgi:hypothetical protein
MRFEDKFKAQHLSRAAKVSDLALISHGYQVGALGRPDQRDRHRAQSLCDAIRSRSIREKHAQTIG